jgi:hypothetical protein
MVFKSAQDFIDEMNSRKPIPLANGPNTVDKTDTGNIAKYGEMCQKLGGQIYKNGNVCKFPKMEIEFQSMDNKKWTGKVQGSL